MKRQPTNPPPTAGREYSAAFDERVAQEDDFLARHLPEILPGATQGLIEALRVEALWAQGAKDFEAIKGREVRAEYSALLSALESAHERLRNLSPNTAAFMLVDEDACVAALGEVIDSLINAKPQIDRIPRAMRDSDWAGWVAEELALRVLRVLKARRLPIAATADKDFDNASSAVRILALVGAIAGFPREETTWREIMGKARKDI